MSDNRAALKAALDQRADAFSEREVIYKAYLDARETVADLMAQQVALDSASQKRSEDLAARTLSAARSGGQSPLRDPIDGQAAKDRVAWTKIEDELTRTRAVVSTLGKAYEEAEHQIAAADAAVKKHRQAVAESDAMAIATRLLEIKAEANLLTTRLITYGATRPSNDFGYMPAVIGNAIHLPVDGTIHISAWNSHPVQAEQTAWVDYLAALDTNADAAPNMNTSIPV